MGVIVCIESDTAISLSRRISIRTMCVCVLSFAVYKGDVRHRCFLGICFYDTNRIGYLFCPFIYVSSGMRVLMRTKQTGPL